MQASPIMVEEGVVAGTYDEYIDHYSVLRTIEEFYGPLAARCRRWGGKVIADAFSKAVTYRCAKTAWRLPLTCSVMCRSVHTRSSGFPKPRH
jgi:hypothetical protein